jgi:phosphoglycerate dehydrogenase-like enzyme
MEALRVLEFIRHADPVWNLPRPLVDDLRRSFPDVVIESPADPEESDRLLPEADIVLGWAVKPANFDRARRLRWIQVTAASVAGLLFPALVESRVIVTNGRGLWSASMAEHAIGVIHMFARKLHLARDAQRERRWVQSELASRGPALRGVAGATLGLVGFGTIGRAIAERASALGMEVVALRRHPSADPAPAREQWPPQRLPELLERSDYVVLAPPLTRETQGMIGADELARMKPGAVLINLGRGPLVDEPALLRALETGALAGAGLDVFDREPLPAESPLWGLPQVILTPHVSGLGERLWERAMDLFSRNLVAFREGRPLENLVDKHAGY